MKKIFTLLLLGIITNEALGRYDYSWGGRNLPNYGPNNNPYILRPVPRSIPEYIGPTNNYYPLPPIPQNLPPVPQTLPPIPQTLPPIPQTLPPIPQTLPPIPQTLPPIPQTLPPVPYTYVQPIKYQPAIPVDYRRPIGSSRSYRYKRQAGENSDNEDLEDKYGWDRPRPQSEPFGPRPWLRPVRPGGRPWPPSNDNGQIPIPNPRPTAQPNPDSDNGSTTQDPAAACISNCPVTSEYNPVCGSNGVTYPNPGRLICAQMCGVNVNLFRQSPCPTTTTTSAPAQN